MRTRTFSFQLILSAAVVVFLATAAYCQQTEYSENQRLNMESHVGGMTGHATTGQPTYKRFCIGCHGSWATDRARTPSGSIRSRGISPLRFFAAVPLQPVRCRPIPICTTPSGAGC